jgi:hypothetical protein
MNLLAEYAECTIAKPARHTNNTLQAYINLPDLLKFLHFLLKCFYLGLLLFYGTNK